MFNLKCGKNILISNPLNIILRSFLSRYQGRNWFLTKQTHHCEWEKLPRWQSTETL